MSSSSPQAQEYRGLLSTLLNSCLLWWLLIQLSLFIGNLPSWLQPSGPGGLFSPRQHPTTLLHEMRTKFYNIPTLIVRGYCAPLFQFIVYLCAYSKQLLKFHVWIGGSYEREIGFARMWLCNGTDSGLRCRGPSSCLCECLSRCDIVYLSLC